MLLGKPRSFHQEGTFNLKVHESDFVPLWDEQFQVYLYSAFYDTIVAKQLYRKLSFYNIFIYCRNLIYLTYGKIW